MGWIWTILIGFLVGVLAKFLHPGKDDLGFIMTTLLGIGGSVLAGAGLCWQYHIFFVIQRIAI